jgi:hypothetical protein
MNVMTHFFLVPGDQKTKVESTGVVRRGEKSISIDLIYPILSKDMWVMSE